MVVFTGNFHLDDAIIRLSQSLKFEMVMSVKLEANHEIVLDWFIEAFPICVFYKSPRVGHPKLSNFMVAKKADRMKTFHLWGKNVEITKTLIEKFSKPDDLIIEPCAGGGSTIQACIETKRNCIAYEINPETFQILKKRFPDAKFN